MTITCPDCNCCETTDDNDALCAGGWGGKCHLKYDELPRYKEDEDVKADNTPPWAVRATDQNSMFIDAAIAVRDACMDASNQEAMVTRVVIEPDGNTLSIKMTTRGKPSEFMRVEFTLEGELKV